MKTSFIDITQKEESLLTIDGYYPVSINEMVFIKTKFYKSIGYSLDLDIMELRVFVTLNNKQLK